MYKMDCHEKRSPDVPKSEIWLEVMISTTDNKQGKIYRATQPLDPWTAEFCNFLVWLRAGALHLWHRQFAESQWRPGAHSSGEDRHLQEQLEESQSLGSAITYLIKSRALILNDDSGWKGIQVWRISYTGVRNKNIFVTTKLKEEKSRFSLTFLTPPTPGCHMADVFSHLPCMADIANLSFDFRLELKKCSCC